MMHFRRTRRRCHRRSQRLACSWCFCLFPLPSFCASLSPTRSLTLRIGMASSNGRSLDLCGEPQSDNLLTQVVPSRLHPRLLQSVRLCRNAKTRSTNVCYHVLDFEHTQNDRSTSETEQTFAPTKLTTQDPTRTYIRPRASHARP